MNDITYTSSELLTINAARLLRDGDVVFVGVGLPNLACNLARRTHAPNLVMIYEAGVIGAQPARLPLSIGDPTLVSGALSVCSMYDIFAFYLQRGNVDVGFLGGAQIDRFANINATTIGDYNHPRYVYPVRVARWKSPPGQIAAIFLRHTKNDAFLKKVHFRTSAGFLGGRAEREAAKLSGAGPLAVVTDLGVMNQMKAANWF